MRNLLIIICAVISSSSFGQDNYSINIYGADRSDPENLINLNQIREVESFSYEKGKGYPVIRIIQTGFQGSDFGFYTSIYSTVIDEDDESDPDVFSFYLGSFSSYGGINETSNGIFEMKGWGYAYYDWLNYDESVFSENFSEEIFQSVVVTINFLNIDAVIITVEITD